MPFHYPGHSTPHFQDRIFVLIFESGNQCSSLSETIDFAKKKCIQFMIENLKNSFLLKNARNICIFDLACLVRANII